MKKAHKPIRARGTVPDQKKFWLIGSASSIGLFILFGIPTALIPTPWFVRMISATFYDYIFLVLSSILLGAYIGVHLYKKKVAKTCDATIVTGGIGSILAFGCPICNQLLVVLFGTTALLAYLEPYRPVLGALSVSLLVAALFWRIRN